MLEFFQHEHPNGDTASVFRIADKAKPNVQLDDAAYVKVLLDFIEEGVGDRPWSTAVDGATTYRLDHGIKNDKRFVETTKEAAQKTIMELLRTAQMENRVGDHRGQSTLDGARAC